MNVLERIHNYARIIPEKTAVWTGKEALTYGELDQMSDRLARELETVCGDNREPVAVYGHKHPYMLVSFLACVKSGRAYCPIDCSVPEGRVGEILASLKSPVVLAPDGNFTGAVKDEDTEEAEAPARQKDSVWIPGQAGAGQGKKQIWGRERLEEIFRSGGEQDVRENYPRPVSGSDLFYIIFTSGSSGTPKGVEITADCLNHFLEWSVSLGASSKGGAVFLNQAPFSFDLSVMDLYTCLACGGTLWCLEKGVQEDYGSLMDSLQASGTQVWVSTPSFAEMCLADPRFDQRLLPGLETFLFCGETLPNRTVLRLMDRFPRAAVVNTYGPTESTVAVTEVSVTREMAEEKTPLPVGRPKPGTWLEIQDPEGNILPEGEQGEIVILGNTVSTGYLSRPDLTDKAFFSRETEKGEVRGYHTRDAGFLRDGMLYCTGRMDLQVKLHGYRIELGDIENNLQKLPGISHAVVIPNRRNGRISSLTAYVSRENPADGAVSERQREETILEAGRMRRQLEELLPAYMIPKKIIFLDHMPLTSNGKADRNALEGEKL